MFMFLPNSIKKICKINSFSCDIDRSFFLLETKNVPSMGTFHFMPEIPEIALKVSFPAPENARIHQFKAPDISK